MVFWVKKCMEPDGFYRSVRSKLNYFLPRDTKGQEKKSCVGLPRITDWLVSAKAKYVSQCIVFLWQSNGSHNRSYTTALDCVEYNAEANSYRLALHSHIDNLGSGYRHACESWNLKTYSYHVTWDVTVMHNNNAVGLVETN